MLPTGPHIGGMRALRPLYRMATPMKCVTNKTPEITAVFENNSFPSGSFLRHTVYTGGEIKSDCSAHSLDNDIVSINLVSDMRS